MQEEWRLLDTEEDLITIKDMLSEFTLVELKGFKDVFVSLGYKNLSSSDKETYYALKELAMLNYGAERDPYVKYGISSECTVSLDYLAVALGTSIECQSRRTKKLENCKLIKKTYQKYKSNKYIVNLNPLPDSTFVDTINKLKLRRECYTVIKEWNSSLDPIQRIETALKLRELSDEPLCKKIIGRRIPFKNITGIIDKT